MNTEAILEQGKIIGGLLGGILSGIFGGFDALFGFVVVLVLSDIITGFIKSIYKKEVSSRVMFKGLINKVIYVIMIDICIFGDKIAFESLGHYIEIGGVEILLRDICMCYIALEELISVLENIADIGMPLPKWLLNILKQVEGAVNSSTPKFITKVIEEKLGIDIKEEENTEDKEND